MGSLYGSVGLPWVFFFLLLLFSCYVIKYSFFTFQCYACFLFDHIFKTSVYVRFIRTHLARIYITLSVDVWFGEKNFVWKSNAWKNGECRGERKKKKHEEPNDEEKNIILWKEFKYFHGRTYRRHCLWVRKPARNGKEVEIRIHWMNSSPRKSVNNSQANWKKSLKSLSTKIYMYM